jgi:hypothetical protein
MTVPRADVATLSNAVHISSALTKAEALQGLAIIDIC